ncbi:MAG: diaminopimelate epimerase [Wenzhouxiangella sp.]
MSTRGRLAFTKLEALGNDFMLVDARQRAFSADADSIRQAGDRRRGVGFDQLLIVESPTETTSTCRVAIYNRDGSRAEQCGNGMRAIALWLARGGEMKQRATIETDAGPVSVYIDRSGMPGATLGIPDFSPAACGISGSDRFPVELDIDGETCSVLGASLGNPHLVVVCDTDPSREDLLRIGPALSRHPRLANGANVGLACPTGRGSIRLRVYERGAGATRACGSGACAAASVLIERGQVDSPVEVVQPGGRLVINWAGQGTPVSMSGPARMVYQGFIEWPPTKSSPKNESSNG